MSSEIDIIIKEKNNKITSLEKEVETLKTEKKEFIEKTTEETAKIRRKAEGMITKETAANDIRNRLIRIRPLAWIGMASPVLSAMIIYQSFMAGMIIAFLSAVGVALLSRREVFDEIKRLNNKYNLDVKK